MRKKIAIERREADWDKVGKIRTNLSRTFRKPKRGKSRQVSERVMHHPNKGLMNDDSLKYIRDKCYQPDS